MNVILKEMLILEVATGEKVLTNEEIAEYITEEHCVNGEAFIVWLGFVDIELFNSQEKLIDVVYNETAVKGLSFEKLIEKFDDDFQGCYDSDEDFAESYFWTRYDCAIDDNNGFHGVLTCVDWTAYWDKQLQYEFYSMGGFYFKD